MPDRELIAILLSGCESKTLDYKGPSEWDENNKRACCTLVKDILGLANTNGGFIAIGVSEMEGGYSWDGLSTEQAVTFDTTRLNRFLQNYSDPPINALLRKVPHAGKTFVIIEVPQFPDTPHICQKEYPGVLTAPTLYVRTDNNETAPIRSSADFRAVIEQATRNRSDALLTSVRSILVGGKQSTKPSAVDQFLSQRSDAIADFEKRNPLNDKNYTGYREAAFFPDRFDENLFTLEQLRAGAEQASINFKGWPFLYLRPDRPNVTYAIQNGLETLVKVNDFSGNDLLAFLRFQQSGFFYQRTLMWEDSQARTKGSAQIAADFGLISIYCAEAIHCLTRLYDGLLADDERVSFAVRLLGTQNRELLSFDPKRDLWGGYACQIPLIEVRREHPLADWRAGMVEHAVEMSKEIFLRFNWKSPNLAAIQDIIDKRFTRQW